MQLSIKYTLSCLFFLVLLETNGQSINSKTLLENIEYLSGDELKGRKTGTEGNAVARSFILNEFKSIALDTQYPDFQQKFTFENRRENKTYENAVNIVGFVAGSESSKLIVITAHYDHVGVGRPNTEGDTIYNGADDNASGTAAVIELAKYFKKNRPQHSMIFAALDGEEMGLQGAKALVKDFPFPLEQIVLNINMDMISRNKNGELYASGTYYNPSLKTILEKATAGSTPKLLFGHDEPNTGGDNWTQSSDHGPFFTANVPHIYFGVEDHPDYHKPSDSFQNIDQEFYVNAVNLILKSILALDAELPKE
ncbi:peptidase M28-like protein [Algoriphagus ratkowskyi]|uniref:M28 family peptidase n=1 Tax=Algoriphagus ratkowskyi TaxID=57028 RepID=A0A2W7S5W0_9BACT|nr:M28 family peptidase [Algoriphagus ratkowskyi]PZX58275.1 peptidase M28-like protein [Algoriphagus ratkowskyi]TXD77846.1 M28 family peptidase [Algoriphagus ratkowskyi]